MDAGEHGRESTAAAPRAGRRRALLLVNRSARSGDSPLAAAIARLEAGGVDVETCGCAEAGDMVRAIRDRGSAFDCIIVGGGDGTLNCCAGPVMRLGLPLGILPLGTANDLARTLGLPLDAVGASEVIVAAAERPIDLGDVNGHLYFNVASIGFSAELARELTSEAKRRYGKLGYAIVGMRLLARMRPFTAFIEHDDTTLKVKTVQISVGNGRHYGGGMTVHEEAEPDDGRLHVYSLEVDHWWRLLALIPWLRRGTHGTWRDVRAFDTTNVTIRTRRNRSVNTDGELTTATPAVFRLIPKAIRVYAPPRPLAPRAA